MKQLIKQYIWRRHRSICAEKRKEQLQALSLPTSKLKFVQLKHNRKYSKKRWNKIWHRKRHKAVRNDQHGHNRKDGQGMTPIKIGDSRTGNQETFPVETSKTLNRREIRIGIHNKGEDGTNSNSHDNNGKSLRETNSNFLDSKGKDNNGKDNNGKDPREEQIKLLSEIDAEISINRNFEMQTHLLSDSIKNRGAKIINNQATTVHTE